MRESRCANATYAYIYLLQNYVKFQIDIYILHQNMIKMRE